MIEIITGDLLEAKEKYVAHQANCVSQKSMGLAKKIFDKFPHSNIYSAREIPDKPGSIYISGDGLEKKFIIHMFGQYYPGKPKYIDSALDGSLIREKYFYKCLVKMSKISNLESVAFPWRIGCGLGGGIWEHYLGTLTNFAEFVGNKYKTKVIIYRPEGSD